MPQRVRVQIACSATTYIRATLPEIATALATLTGEDHPLASRTPGEE